MSKGKKVAPEEGAAKKGSVPKRAIGALLRFAVLAAVVAASIYIVANYQNVSMKNIRDFFNFGGDSVEYVETFKFTASSHNVYSPYNSGLAVLTTTGLSAMDAAGLEQMGTAVSFSRPALKAKGGYLLAYDVGGVNIIYAEGYKIQFSKALSETIVVCDVNEQGWYVIVSEEGGSKATATLYDNEMNKRFKWVSAKSYLHCAAVSRDSKLLAVGGVKQVDARILSTVTMLERTSEEPYGIYECYDDIILDMVYLSGNTLLIITERAAVFCNNKGEKTGEYLFTGDLKLTEYVWDDSGFLTLRFGDKGVTTSRVVTVDGEGKQIAEASVDSVKSMSASGGNIGLLTNDKVLVYNNKMEKIESFDISAGSRKVFLRDDGTFLVLTADTAGVYKY